MNIPKQLTTFWLYPLMLISPWTHWLGEMQSNAADVQGIDGTGVGFGLYLQQISVLLSQVYQKRIQ